MNFTAASALAATVSQAAFHGVKLTWVDNTNNENGFEVWRRPVASSVWTKVVTTFANVTSVTFGNPTSGGYVYKVRARRWVSLLQMWIYSHWSAERYVVLQ